MARVSDSQSSLCCLADMRDGDVAEILTWHHNDLSPGDVIQRYEDAIIPIGKTSGEAYTTLLTAPMSPVCYSNKVRILRKGTLIEL